MPTTSTSLRPAVLICEDSRMDRMRFRNLLSPCGIAWDFAWAWRKEDRCSVVSWFERLSGHNSPAPQPTQALNTYLRSLNASAENIVWDGLGRYQVLLLDLAWTNAAESEMQTLQLLSAREGYCLATADINNTDVSTMDGALSDQLYRLLANVDGLTLLEWMKRLSSRLQLRPPLVWVTSAYVPASAEGIREFLRVRYGVLDGQLFHKWMDEDNLVATLTKVLEDGDSNASR